MVNDIYLDRKHLAIYYGCHRNTATKRYKRLLELSGKSLDQQLSMYDISRVDKVPVDYVHFRIFG